MVLAKHDTEANTQLLLAMDSEAPKKQPTKRKRQPPKRVPARAPKAGTTPASVMRLALTRQSIPEKAELFQMVARRAGEVSVSSEYK